MKIFRGFEEWGRNRAMNTLVSLLATREVPIDQARRDLERRQNPKILLIGLFQKMGQFLCATPLIRTLSSGWPRAELQFLGNPGNVPAARLVPPLSRVWSWDKSAPGQWPAQFFRLRKEKFDLALMLTTERPSATGTALARALGARWLAGYSATGDQGWEKGSSQLCNLRILPSNELNEVQKYLGLARAFGLEPQGAQPEISLSSEDRAAAAAFLSTHSQIAARPRIGLFLGGKSDRTDRLWPVGHLSKVAESLKAKGFSVTALGPPAPARGRDATYQPDEFRRVQEFSQSLSWPCPVFQDSRLSRVAAFLQQLDLLVCPDGGVLHLAASAGTPTLGLFFSTDPAVWRHSGPHSVLDGRGRPAADLSPETVLAEILKALGKPVES